MQKNHQEKKTALAVDGRLFRAVIPNSAKHQISFLVLNKLSWSCCLSDEYQNKPHFGTEYILLTVKEKFYLMNGMLLIKQVIRNCMVCRRRNTKITFPYISDLHFFWVEHGNPPFQKSGVKFFATVCLKQM